jgi:hypothetical protein
MTERDKFDTAMRNVLSVSKQELQRRIEAEKAAKASSSASRVPVERGQN